MKKRGKMCVCQPGSARSHSYFYDITLITDAQMHLIKAKE